MKLLPRWTTVICFVLAFTLNWTPPSFALQDAIIAVVNDELITLKDLKDYVQSTYVSLVAEGIDDTQLQTVMKDLEANGINKLIEDKLVLSKANKIGLVVREELIDERIQAMETKYGSRQNLVDALVKNGATVTDLREKIKDQMKIKYIIDHQVRSKIYVNPQEVTDFYEANPEQFNREDRVNLESIFFNYGDDKEAARTKAAEILKQIEGGGDFYELAQEHSQAPSVGIVERGQLLSAIEEIVFPLNLNETSPLVEVDSGIYIFKLIGKNPAQISSLEDVKNTIHDLLFKEKFKGRFIRWLEKLKKDAYIEIKQ